MEAFDESSLVEFLGLWRWLNWSGSTNCELVLDEADEFDGSGR